MKPIKMLGLAGLTVIAAMALVGVTSALATGSTALCSASEDPCAAGNQVTAVHMVAGESVLKTTLATILCLSALLSTTSDGAPLGNPLGLTISSLTWGAAGTCGSVAAHNNCTTTTLNSGLMDVLRTGANVGTATLLNTQVLVHCTGIPIIGLTHCIYGGKEVPGFGVKGGSATSNGTFTATKLVLPKVSGFLCSEVTEWTATYESLTKIFVSS